MKKLTFAELEANFAHLDDVEQSNTIGGNGVVVSGSGSYLDPYVVRITLYMDASVTVSQQQMLINGAYKGLGSGQPQGTTSGKYYSFEIATGTVANESAFDSTYKPTAYQTGAVYVNVTSASLGFDANGNPIYGQTSINGSVGDKIVISQYALAATGNISKAWEGAMAHEVGHSLGLSHSSMGIMTNLAFEYDPNTSSWTYKSGPLSATGYGFDMTEMYNSGFLYQPL